MNDTGSASLLYSRVSKTPHDEPPENRDPADDEMLDPDEEDAVEQEKECKLMDALDRFLGIDQTLPRDKYESKKAGDGKDGKAES